MHDCIGRIEYWCLQFSCRRMWCWEEVWCLSVWTVHQVWLVVFEMLHVTVLLFLVG
jgi:hypothetical protein